MRVEQSWLLEGGGSISNRPGEACREVSGSDSLSLSVGVMGGWFRAKAYTVGERLAVTKGENRTNKVKA